MAMKFKWLFLLMASLVAALSAPSQAQQQTTPLPILAKHARWQALLHWNGGTTWRSRNKSYVTQEDFFISPHGRSDALAELEATVEALQPAGSPQRCQYPARFRFLAEQLGWSTEGAFDHCEEYLDWQEKVPRDQILLVFPAAYLNSPSSMFGHTLLRLDDGDEDGTWLSWAVNFGAAMEDDASMLYIYRGLAGSYPGYFSTVPYHTKVQEYAYIENRDMWEYPLNLNKEERDWLVDHLWELQDVRFDYYFLDENCSFRLLELMEVARPGTNLLSDLRFTEIPVDTVRSLSKENFIEDERYRSSKAVELQTLGKAMTAAEKKLAKRLAKTPTLTDSDAFQSLNTEQQQNVVKAAYEYLRFKQRKKEQRDPDTAKRSMQLLHALNNYSGAKEKVAVTPPERPETGHSTKMISASAGAFEDQAFGELEYRWAYHDWFDPAAGFLPGAHIEAFNAKLRYQEQDKLRLQALHLVDIRSLAVRDAFVKPISWFVRGGFERTAIDRDYRLASYLEGGPGMAWQWRNIRPYAYLNGRVEHHGANKQYIEPGVGASVGALWHGPKGIVLGLGGKSHYFLHDAVRHQGNVTANFPVAKNHAVRLEVNHQAGHKKGDTEGQMSWRYYFD